MVGEGWEGGLGRCGAPGWGWGGVVGGEEARGGEGVHGGWCTSLARGRGRPVVGRGPGRGGDEGPVRSTGGQWRVVYLLGAGAFQPLGGLQRGYHQLEPMQTHPGS